MLTPHKSTVLGGDDTSVQIESLCDLKKRPKYSRMTEHLQLSQFLGFGQWTIRMLDRSVYDPLFKPLKRIEYADGPCCFMIKVNRRIN